MLLWRWEGPLGGTACAPPRSTCVSGPVRRRSSPGVGGSVFQSRLFPRFERRRRVLVGAAFFAPDMAALLHLATIAANAEVPLDRLWHAVPPVPTVGEIWLHLLEQYGL